jgi:hypothetical protein
VLVLAHASSPLDGAIHYNRGARSLEARRLIGGAGHQR